MKGIKEGTCLSISEDRNPAGEERMKHGEFSNAKEEVDVQAVRNHE
jgi:hypothetical protein